MPIKWCVSPFWRERYNPLIYKWWPSCQLWTEQLRVSVAENALSIAHKASDYNEFALPCYLQRIPVKFSSTYVLLITPNCLFLFVASREDYLFAGFPVSLSADNTTICFSAGILEDDEVEDTEDFTLVLTSDPNSMVVIMEGETTVFIADNGEDIVFEVCMHGQF